MRLNSSARLAVAVSLLLFGIPGSRLEARTIPLKDVYPRDLSFTFQMTGYFSTGIALVDLNKDGFPDLVLSNGNDMSPQPLAVYYSIGKVGVFKPIPDWYSETNGYRTAVAVGDVNGDSWPDLAAVVSMDASRNMATGGVEVFLNRNGMLEPRPSYRTGGGYLAGGCAFGDVDADADLDLIVAVLTEGAGTFVSSDVARGRGRIYLNQDGTLEPYPAWITTQDIMAGDALAADVNQDGWMDVAFSGNQTRVYYGRPPDGSPVPISPEPGWSSAEQHQLSLSLDAGFAGLVNLDPSVPSGRGLMLAVSSGCMPNTGCTSRFMVYQPDRQTAFVWRSEPAELSSHVLLADLNDSGTLALAGTQWGVPFGTSGAPIRLYGWLSQGYYPDKADVNLAPKRAGQDLAVADVRRQSVTPAAQSFKAGQPVGVLTLPQRRIAAIDEVRREGRKLATAEYAWTPDSNWISLREPLAAGSSIEVRYQISPTLDLAAAVWQPQYPTSIYLSEVGN